ncbi:MAG TPA: hypothetical protein VHT25_07925 [Solirubrobacteraceae bacterium]|nr:hypothetical protein [Solirubrobacteraceae bacterium]
MSRLLRALGVSVCAGALLVAAGCGGGGHGAAATNAGNGAANPAYLAAVTRAADATDQIPGYKFSITSTTQANGKNVEVSGTGSINDRGSEGAARLQVEGKTIEEVISKPYLYVSVPSGSGTNVTHGKPWVRADLSTFSQSFGSSSIGAGSSNPSEVLSYLRAAGTVTRVGDDQVRGVSSTHYHALIDLSRFASALPPSQQVAGRKEGKLLERVTGAKTLPMDVWIGAGRIDRVALAFSLCTQQVRVQETLSMDIYDYGRQPAVTPPQASQVTDIAAKLKSDVAKALAQLGCH